MALAFVFWPEIPGTHMQTLQAIFFDIGDTLVTKSNGGYQALPGIQTLLNELTAIPIPLGMISNTGNLTAQQLRADLQNAFNWALFQPDLIILSSVVGVKKPNLRIYEIAVEKSGFAANACLYCSESLDEVLAAERAGMIGARLQKPPQSDASDLVPSLKTAGFLP